MTSNVIKELINLGKVTEPDSAKGRLLRAAAHLFKNKGYERTTVRELGKAVGIQSGSLFHHFKTKEDILCTIMEESILINLARMDQAIKQAKSAQQQLLALIQCELESVHQDTSEAMSLLVYEWRSLSEDNQQHILILREKYESYWMTAINQCVEKKLVQHDPFVLRRLMAGAISWTTTWYKKEGELSLEDLSMQTLQLAVKLK